MENKKLISNVSIGADPEMFLWSEQQQKYVPVVGLVGGTKGKPLPISTKEGYFLQEDNVMVEYCIPPAKTRGQFLESIEFVKNYIDETVLARYGLKSRCVASAFFEKSQLMSDQAQEFGCEPDYNAYTYEENSVSKGNPLLRTAGGHIHVGFDNPNPDTSNKIVRAMDLYLGLPSILLDPDTERRKMYGKAGAFRLKKYGVEYRVLSTFWTDNVQLMSWAFDSTQKAIDFVNMGGIITNEDEIVEAINTCNKEKVINILDAYNIDVEEFDTMIIKD